MYAVIQLHYLFSEEMINILFYFILFFSKFRVVSVCFGLLRNSSVCFGCFDIGSKHRNKPKFFVLRFTKQTETNAKQILFRFVSVRTEIYFCLFRGHPTSNLIPWSEEKCVKGSRDFYQLRLRVLGLSIIF
jgi:hypothetical protein